MEKQPKKRIMTEETKAMLKQKRKEKSVKIKELEKKIEEIPKQELPKQEVKREYSRRSQNNVYSGPDINTRLSNLENLMMQSKNDIFEIKTRKEIKDRLKAKKAEVQEEKEKTIDREEVKKVNDEIKRVNHEIVGLEYSNLFY
jgi:hypothetical protein